MFASETARRARKVSSRKGSRGKPATLPSTPITRPGPVPIPGTTKSQSFATPATGTVAARGGLCHFIQTADRPFRLSTTRVPTHAATPAQTMRIAFLGLPIAALLLQADGHEIVLAGLRRGLTIGARRLRRRVGSERVMIDPQRDWSAFERRLRRESPCLLVSWFFTRRIPMRLCDACPLGGIGVHPSLLPRHRGPDPYFAAIDAGDAVTGVTVHRIEAEYDAGAIIDSKIVGIDPSWSAWQLARALDGPSLELLRGTVHRLSQGQELSAVPQDPAQASHAPLPGDDERILRWNQPAERIERRVRALSPRPGALAWIKDTELVVTKVSIHPCPPRALLPGEATVADGVAVVRAADIGVVLLRGEADGVVLGPADLALLIARATENRTSDSERVLT